MEMIMNILAGYLLGSIPFGYLLVKLAGKGDVRDVGSGATGATNVNRVGGMKLAVLTMVLDLLKAFFAVYFFGLWAGVAAVAGHNFPVWLGFKGGKGLASSGGFLLGLSPLAFLFSFAIWVIAALGFGYSSLAALIVLAIAPFAFGFAISNTAGWACVALAALGFFQHRANIKRLLNGTEDKIKWKKKK